MIRARTPGTSDSSLRPDGATMHSELLRQSGDTDAVGAGCSHSVHFLLSQPCSSASPWLCGGLDEWVVRLANRLGRVAEPLIPRGSQPLDPLSPVPVVVGGVHERLPEAIVTRGVETAPQEAALRAAFCVSGVSCDSTPEISPSRHYAPPMVVCLQPRA